jgi:uncharacterized RDD family membrane protein YckC
MFCPRCGTQSPEPAGYCAQCGSPFRVGIATAPGPPPLPSFRYAGFWLRFWAYLIDGIILGAIPLLIAVIMAPLFFTGGAGVAMLGSVIFLFPVILTEGWLYYALMETSSYQATIGKRALGLKVTGMNGEAISFGKATVRYLGKILSHMILSVGYIMAAFTEKKQALHDILAGCLVIHVPPTEPRA